MASRRRVSAEGGFPDADSATHLGIGPAPQLVLGPALAVHLGGDVRADCAKLAQELSDDRLDGKATGQRLCLFVDSGHLWKKQTY